MDENTAGTPNKPPLLASYSDTQLIEELKRRGYEVYKWREMPQWGEERPPLNPARTKDGKPSFRQIKP